MALVYVQPHRVRRRGFRGLGDCAPFGGDVYSGVQYCRDNVTGSLVPCTDSACKPAGPAASNMPGFIPAGQPKYATMQFGLSTTTTFTLQSYMDQKVQEFTAESPLSLQNQGITPSTAAGQLMQLAQQYCAVEGPPDCGQINSIVAAAAAQVAGAYANIPASQWNPATFTAYAPSSGGGSGGAGSGGGGDVGSSGGMHTVTSPGPSIPVSVAMKNLTRPGSDTTYQVGDQWQITITGNPGAAVTGSSSQNGKSLGSSAFGNLNGSGQMVLTGAMTVDQIGAWKESWNVASQSLSFQEVDFTVVPAAPGGTAGSTGGAGGGTAGGGTTNAAAATTTGFTLPDLSQIPTWAWLAGGGVLLLMFMKK